MAAVSVTLFFAAFIGLVALFTLKYWELSTGRQLWSLQRAHADDRARVLKASLVRLSHEANTWPPKTALIARYLVHIAALELARGLSAGEAALHRLADRVSHKHHFERRETHSTFLKEVAQGKTTAHTVEKDA